MDGAKKRYPHKTDRDYRLEKDKAYFNLDGVLMPAGTPIPDRVCGGCDHYIHGRLELNCQAGGGCMGCTGPLRPACKKYKSKDV